VKVPIVTLTTDFGVRDPYVAEMKAVLIDRCPEARLVDVTHEIAPGDVREATWVLGRIWARFPPDTVHLVVVDPGVGSERLAVAVRVAERWFTGPDNGLLTTVLDRPPPVGAWRVDPARLASGAVSDTFHGRDVFAPAAAHLACRGRPDAFGEPIDAACLIRLRQDAAEGDEERLRGRVVHVDRFGNLITDIPSAWLEARSTVSVAGRTVSGIERSYSAVPSGALLCTRGSGGTLEISARGSSAAALLGVGRDEPVTVEKGSAQ
jgi:S-adenosylmethionine hydrolase